MSQRYVSVITQQLRRNRKTIFAWAIIWTLVGLLFSYVFKTMSSEASESARIYQSLPPAVLKTFNISNDYLSKPEKFLSGQFLSIYLLSGSIMAVMAGAHAIGGRIADRTLFNFLTKRLPRPMFYLLQATALILTQLALNIVAGIAMFATFTLLSGADPDVKYFLSLFAGSTAVFVMFGMFGLLAGLFLEKGRAAATGSALAVISFFLNGLGSLDGVPSWVQKCSVYYYLNPEHLRDAYALDARIFVLAALAVIFLTAGTFVFRKKDIYL